MPIVTSLLLGRPTRDSVKTISRNVINPAIEYSIFVILAEARIHFRNRWLLDSGLRRSDIYYIVGLIMIN